MESLLAHIPIPILCIR